MVKFYDFAKDFKELYKNMEAKELRSYAEIFSYLRGVA